MQSDNDFEKILTDFFKKHDKRQLRGGRKPHKIAVAFKGREDEVMEHLYNKYNVAPKKGERSPSPTLPKGKGEKSSSPLASGETEERGESEKVEKPEVEEPKSKKKLFIIIAIIAILAAAGVAGYFFKDKIFGNTAAIEEKTPLKNTEEATPAKDEVEKTEEVKAPEAEQVETDEQTRVEEDSI